MLPDNVARTFARIPEAQTVLVEMGHAYGKAKYPGRCPMTGMVIGPGTFIRKVVCWTRDGRQLDAHVHCRSAEFWAFRGGCEGLAGETGDMPWSSWRCFTDTDAFIAAVGVLDDAAIGTVITVADNNPCFPTMLTKSWRRTADGWTACQVACSAAEPSRGHGGGRTTCRQLAAAFARRKGGVAFRIDLPR